MRDHRLHPDSAEPDTRGVLTVGSPGAGLVMATTLIMVAVAGCQTNPRVVQIANGGTTMVYDAGIDRVLYLGRDNGPNLLNVSADIYQPRPTDRYGYVFRGSAYTWLAPQSEWMHTDGSLSDWPPDPAVDSPSMDILTHSPSRLVLLGPVVRRGLRERKVWAIDSDGAVQLTVTLLPAGNVVPRASIWSTTTVRQGAILAVPNGPVGSSEPAVSEAWRKAITSSGHWKVLDVSKFRGDGKILIDAAPMVAAWRGGYWLVRSGERRSSPLSPQNAQIEIYMDSRKGLYELELIGSYVPVDGDGGNTWRETWRIIPSQIADTSVLPERLLETEESIAR